MTNRNNLISYILEHQEFFFYAISLHYPFKLSQLEKYEKLLNWHSISSNTEIQWSHEILEKLKNNIDWNAISGNESAFKDVSTLDTFQDKLSCPGGKKEWQSDLSLNRGLPWNIDFIGKYESKIDFALLSANTAKLWNTQLIDKYVHLWDWDMLCSNDSVPWSLYLFERYLGESFLESNIVDFSTTLYSDFHFIEKYKDQLNWESVCAKAILPWKQHSLHEYWENYVDWRGIARNEIFFEGDRSFFKKNLPHWEENNYESFKNLSGNKALPWSIEFIQKYHKHWDWLEISLNPGIPWSINLVEEFLKDLTWGGFVSCPLYNDEGEAISPTGGRGKTFGLVYNTSIPWSLEFLKKFERFIELEILSENKSMWNRIFKSYVNDELIELVVRLI